MHLNRKDSKGEYLDKVFVFDLVKFEYNMWLEIQDIIKNHKGIHA